MIIQATGLKRGNMRTPEKRVRTYISTLVKAGILIFICTTLGIATPRVLAASGDWPTYLSGNGRSGFNGAETTINPGSAPNLKLNWSFNASGSISSQPVEANGQIYWGSWDGLEHATNIDGSQAWTINLGQTINPKCHPSLAGVASTATVASIQINGAPTSVVFVGGGNATFYAMNASDGSIIWSTQLVSSPNYFIWSSPAFYNGSIYIGLSSFGDCPLVPGKLVQMDATSGIIQQTFTTVPTGCLGGGVWGSPAIDESTGTLYFGTSNTNTKCTNPGPYIYALIELNTSDLSLVGSWQVPPTEISKDGDFGSTPTLFQATIGNTVHNMVGIANKNGLYYAFDRANISNGPVWEVRVAKTGACPQCGGGSISPSAWDGTTLYVAGGSSVIKQMRCKGSLRALNPATGALIWIHCMNDGPVLGAVSAVPGVVVVGEGPDIVLVAANTGNTLFTYSDTNSGSAFYGAASISNGVLYVGNMDGILYAFGI